MKTTEIKIYNLIIKGTVNNEDKYKDDEELAIDLLVDSAKKHPELLLEVIAKSFKYDYVGMALPALAAYLCSPSIAIINSKIRFYIIDLLSTLDPGSLLEIVEYMQSKIFGKGLGSRNQKIIRDVMEKWSVLTLKRYTSSYPKELKKLLETIHPRYQGDKGLLVKNITNKLV